MAKQAVELALRRGCRNEAVAAIDRAFETDDEPITFDSPLSAVFDARMAGCLERAGVLTVGDLTRLTVGDLMEVKQLHFRSIKVIQDVLDRHGFALRY